MATGTVKFFNHQRAFGFLKPDDSDADLFVHISAFDETIDMLAEGQRVKFEIGTDRNGRPCAIAVRPL